MVVLAFDACCLVTIFPIISISKNNFLFLRLKNLFDNPKWTKNKNCSQNLISEGH